jgi:hypothetical protein
MALCVNCQFSRSCWLACAPLPRRKSGSRKYFIVGSLILWIEVSKVKDSRIGFDQVVGQGSQDCNWDVSPVRFERRNRTDRLPMRFVHSKIPKLRTWARFPSPAP